MSKQFITNFIICGATSNVLTLFRPYSICSAVLKKQNFRRNAGRCWTNLHDVFRLTLCSETTASEKKKRQRVISFQVPWTCEESCICWEVGKKHIWANVLHWLLRDQRHWTSTCRCPAAKKMNFVKWKQH